MARISELHGRKQGWLFDKAWRAALALGALDRFRRVEWEKVERLVFVCKGNLCRSPYSEHRARGLGANAISFGLAAKGGERPPTLVVEVARERGVNLSEHRTRARVAVPLERGDLVLAMEPRQARELEAAARSSLAQVSLLGLWSKEPFPYLQDPWGLSCEFHRTCFSRIDGAIEQTLRLAPTVRHRKGA